MWIWLKSPMFVNQIKHVNLRLKIQSIKANPLILNQAIVTPWMNLNQGIRSMNLKQITESFMMNQTNQMLPPWIRVSTMPPGEYPWTHDFMLFECKWNLLWYNEYVDEMNAYQNMQMLRVSDLDELMKGRVNFGVWQQLLAKIPSFCLDFPKVRYSIYQDKFYVLCL